MAGKAGGLKGVALIGGGANSTVAGALHFFQDPSTGYTEVRGKVTGLAPGMHGFHIHFFGDTTNGCNSTEAPILTPTISPMEHNWVSILQYIEQLPIVGGSENGEVALLRSSQNKLYVLPLDIVCDGKEKTMPRVLGSYTLESLEKVSVGLGLQALRVHMIDSKTHLFLTRTSKEAQDVLGLLSVTNFPKLNHEIDLQSWENIQVKLFEKCICGSAKMGIFLYFMLMFWRNDAEDHTEFDIEEFHDSNQRNGHLSHNSVHLVGQKGRQKFKRRVFPFKNHNGTKPETIKINGDQVDEHVLVEGNGHLTCNSSKSTHKEEGSESQYLRILPNNASTNIISSNIDEHKIVKDFFNLEVANNDKSETCEQVARCACLFLDASATVQREVALLRSSQNKLYVLLLDVVCDGKETMPRVLGSYTLESLEKVSIGLGLQALSWENIQVKLFEKCICGSAKMGIFLYSMLMFWRNDAEDFGRSHWVSLMDLSSTRPIYSAFNLLGATRMPSSFVDPPSSFWNFVAMAGCYSASIVFRSVVFPAGGRVADGIDFRLLMGITESDLESATPM